MAETPQHFRTAAEHFSELVAAIPDDRWDSATPCVEWDVRALVRHVAEEMLWVAPLFSGETIESVGDRFEGDILGDDPKAAWVAAVGPAIEAIEAPGAMDAVCQLSMGPTPGREYAGQLIVDLTVHGWDLARAAGLDETIDPELVEACLKTIEPWKPMLASMGDYFAPPVEPADDADSATVLLNTLGRRP
jgi:uncharacterized protein (TIGR03086 family)